MTFKKEILRSSGYRRKELRSKKVDDLVEEELNDL